MKKKEYDLKSDNMDIVSEPLMDSIFPSDINQNDDMLRVLSLFSGCGGMDIGLEGGFVCNSLSVPTKENIEIDLGKGWVKLKNTRMQTVFACDILPEARIAWMNYMYSKNGILPRYHLESVVELVNRHKKGQNIFPKNIDIVTGGFPCQDFSVAGKRKGFKSQVTHDGKRVEDINNENLSRGKLYTWMKEVIEITSPKVFIAENVKGLISLGDVKKIIQNDFASAGEEGYFVFEPQILNAADYGVPETRERVIFIGVKKNALRPEVRSIIERNEDIPDFLNPYPKPSHSYQKLGKNNFIVKCEDVLGFLPEPENSSDPSHHFYSKAKYLGNGTQGQTEINMGGVGPTIRAEHHGNIEFRRLSQENGGKNIEELKAGLIQRRLSPRECALIQTFPPDYKFVIYKPNGKGFAVSPSMAYKIIGNAVPPMLAYNIAKRLEDVWDKYFC